MKVSGPGVVLVEWKRGMLAGLDGRVRTVPARKVAQDTGSEPSAEGGTGSLVSLDGRVDGCLRDGRKLEAIRLVREELGLGLAEAKRWVEERERRSA